MPDNRMSKQEWVALFRQTGLSEEMMQSWHRLFEQTKPEAHQAFLEWLSISAEEIRDIRAWASKPQ